jgi:hypothetical protein
MKEAKHLQMKIGTGLDESTRKLCEYGDTTIVLVMIGKKKELMIKI